MRRDGKWDGRYRTETRKGCRSSTPFSLILIVLVLARIPISIPVPQLLFNLFLGIDAFKEMNYRIQSFFNRRAVFVEPPGPESR